MRASEYVRRMGIVEPLRGARSITISQAQELVFPLSRCSNQQRETVTNNVLKFIQRHPGISKPELLKLLRLREYTAKKGHSDACGGREN